MNGDSRLDVIDVLNVQLENVRKKLKQPDGRVRLIQCDATRLDCPDAAYDQALMFFLPHELPEDKRRQALSEAVRVVKPGGKIILVEFHKPAMVASSSVLATPRLFPFRTVCNRYVAS